MKFFRYHILSVLALFGVVSATAVAQDDEVKVVSATLRIPRIYDFNLNWSTMGGKQVWSDQRHRSGWRIQRNTLTGHFRVLDAKNVRRAWGPEEHCQKKFKELVTKEKVLPNRGRATIVLHGLGRSSATMALLSKHLDSRGLNPIQVTYASTRETVDEHAKGLAKLIDGLGEVTHIDFVGHSLGNIVVRRYMKQQLDKNGRLDVRIKRMVMLGPPNQGATMARLFKSNGIFRLIAGESGFQLSNDWSSLEERLAIPPIQFGIIAGNKGRNPLLVGEDDLIVRVSETQLPGARDFLVLPVIHAFMVKDAKVHQRVHRFLEFGFFDTEETRKPIPLEKKSTKPGRPTQ